MDKSLVGLRLFRRIFPIVHYLPRAKYLLSLSLFINSNEDKVMVLSLGKKVFPFTTLAVYSIPRITKGFSENRIG